MKNVIEVPSSEELLKIYFLKLYERRIPDLEFDEKKVNALICSKSFDELTSAELFDCCYINERWINRPLSDFIPKKFYYFSEIDIVFDSVNNYPFLYTSFKKLNGIEIYEGSFGLFGSGVDLLNSDAIILESIYPNLYDRGYSFISVLSDKYLIVTICDENNGEYHNLYNYVDNKLIEINEIDDKEMMLNLIRLGDCSFLLYFASDRLLDDKEIIIAAIAQNIDSLNFASDRLKKDPDLKLIVFENIPKNVEKLNNFFNDENQKNDKPSKMLDDELDENLPF